MSDIKRQWLSKFSENGRNVIAAALCVCVSDQHFGFFGKIGIGRYLGIWHRAMQDIDEDLSVGVIGESVGAEEQITASPRLKRRAEKVDVELFGNADRACNDVFSRIGFGFFWCELTVIDQILYEGMIFGDLLGFVACYDIKTAVAYVDGVEIALIDEDGNERCAHAKIFRVIARELKNGNAFITKSIAPCTTVSIKSQELQFKARNCEGCPKANPDPFWENQKA